MKSILKKSAAVLLILCVVLSVVSINVFAAGSSIAFNKSSLTIGENLSVTARFSTASSDPMYGLEGYMTYDPKIIKFVSGDNCKLVTDGKVKIVLTSAGKVNLTETVKFKTLVAGKSTIALEQIIYVDEDLIERSMTGATAAVTVTNPSVQASSNADLRKLGVSAGTLTPAFSPDVTSYNVTIPYSETELWVQPGLADQKASYIVEGSKDMKVGYNKRVIIVTAENGKTKSYTVNITRLDENGEVPDTEIDTPINDMVEVFVNGETMYINENFSTEDIPAGFEITDFAISGKNVPALTDQNIIILNLIKPDGSGAAFYIRNSDESFSLLNILKIGEATYYPIKTTEIPEGYTETELVIGETTVTAYVSDDLNEKEFALIYAKGPLGYTGFYRYDTVEATMQRAPEILTTVIEKEDEKKEETSGSIIENFKSLTRFEKIIVITILIIILLIIVIIIILIVRLFGSSREARQLKKLEKEAEEQVGFDYVSIGEAPKTQDEDNIIIEEEELDETIEIEEDETKTEE